jgi:hypothetical protein
MIEDRHDRWEGDLREGRQKRRKNLRKKDH